MDELRERLARAERTSLRLGAHLLILALAFVGAVARMEGMVAFVAFFSGAVEIQVWCRGLRRRNRTRRR